MNATESPFIAARYHFVDLVHAEVTLAEFNAAESTRAIEHDRRQNYGPGSPAFTVWFAEWEAMQQHRMELAAEIEAEYAKVAHMLCAKCRGTGTTQWKHRSGGVCYTCMGHGWKKAYLPARNAVVLPGTRVIKDAGSFGGMIEREAAPDRRDGARVYVVRDDITGQCGRVRAGEMRVVSLPGFPRVSELEGSR